MVHENALNACCWCWLLLLLLALLLCVSARSRETKTNKVIVCRQDWNKNHRKLDRKRKIKKNIHTIYVISIHIWQHRTHIRNNDAIKKAFFTFLHFFFASFCRYRLLRIASYTTLAHSLIRSFARCLGSTLILIIDVSKCEFYSISLNCLAWKQSKKKRNQHIGNIVAIQYDSDWFGWFEWFIIEYTLDSPHNFFFLLTPLLYWCFCATQFLFLSFFEFIRSKCLSSVQYSLCKLDYSLAWPVRFFSL